MKTGSIASLVKTHPQPAAQAEQQEKIRVRAYELYQKRGAGDGHDLDDWLQAEAEMSRPKSRAASAPASSN